MSNQIIENYQRGEGMMILIFAQWCINNDLNPIELYKKAYPQQESNDLLKKALEQTVPKQESEFISDETVINVLSMYGNEELAFMVSEVPREKTL